VSEAMGLEPTSLAAVFTISFSTVVIAFSPPFVV
jgi:hypothetical protein